MEYISNDIIELKNNLKKSICIFEFKKTDGTIRMSKGTCLQTVIDEFVPPYDVFKDPKLIKIEKNIVDIIIKEHNYSDLNEYANENDVDIVDSSGDEFYFFLPKKKKHKVSEGVLMYFDLDKKQFRSFKKENYLGTIEILNV